MWGRLKCRIGLHKDVVTNMETTLGYGFFGGPVTFFEGYCARCGRRYFRS